VASTGDAGMERRRRRGRGLILIGSLVLLIGFTVLAVWVAGSAQQGGQGVVPGDEGSFGLIAAISGLVTSIAGLITAVAGLITVMNARRHDRPRHRR
jgi:hypothetical protein